MLQKNERLVLQHLAENARCTDTEIAQQIGLSTQAVGKIRHKLENDGVIEGYVAKFNHVAIGLPIVTIAAIAIPPHMIQHEQEFKSRVIKEPNVIYCHRLFHGGAHFLIVFSFRTLEENEKYVKTFQRLFPEVSIVDLQTSSWDTVWKSTKRDVVLQALREEEMVPFENKECEHCYNNAGLKKTKQKHRG